MLSVKAEHAIMVNQHPEALSKDGQRAFVVRSRPPHMGHSEFDFGAVVVPDANRLQLPPVFSGLSSHGAERSYPGVVSK